MQQLNWQLDLHRWLPEHIVLKNKGTYRLLKGIKYIERRLGTKYTKPKIKVNNG
jgi:DNA-directed RNA polymerase subunit H (RpoH/RPB5)